MPTIAVFIIAFNSHTLPYCACEASQLKLTKFSPDAIQTYAIFLAWAGSESFSMWACAPIFVQYADQTQAQSVVTRSNDSASSQSLAFAQMLLIQTEAS